MRLIALILVGMFSIGGRAEILAQESISQDTAKLNLQLPAGATVTVDGRDYGLKRQLVFSRLQPGRRYESKIVVQLLDGKQENRTVSLVGGQRFDILVRDPNALLPEVVVQTGHASHIFDVAFSNDDRFIVTASADGTAILWDAQSGRQLRTFSGHGNAVHHVAFTREDRRLLTASETSEDVIVWDVTTGEELERIDFPHLAHLSNDSRWVVTHEYKDNLVLWDVLSKNKKQTFDIDRSVSEVCVSPDGDRLLAVVYKDPGPSVITWNTETGKRLTEFQGHRYDILGATFSQDGMQVVSDAYNPDESDARNSEIILWGSETGKQIARLTSESVFDGTFSPDDKHLFFKSLVQKGMQQVGRLRKFDASNLKEINQPGMSMPALESADLAFNKDGSRITNSVGVWNVSDGRQILDLSRNTVSGKMAAFSTVGNTILVDSTDAVMVIDPQSGKSQKLAPSLKKHSVWSIGVSGDGSQSYIVASPHASESTFCALCDLATGEELSRVDLGGNVRNHNLTISYDGSRIAANVDLKAVVWDVSTGRVLRKIDGDSYVAITAISPNGKWLLTSKGDADYRNKSKKYAALWDVDTGREVRALRLKYPPKGYGWSFHYCGFSPNGRTAVLAGSANPVENRPKKVEMLTFWDVRTGELIRTIYGQAGEVSFGQFTPDGRYFVSHGNDLSTVWDVTTGIQVRSFRFRHGFNNYPTLSADGRWLAHAGAGGRLQFWDVATGQEVYSLIRINGGKDWLAVTPEGLFDGTAEGRKQVGFRIGGGLNVVPVDRFFQDFYHPGLLTSIWQGERPVPEVSTDSLGSPPKVRIVSPTESGDVNAVTISLQAEVSDTGGGIKPPWLLHNGARVLAPSESKRDGKKLLRTFSVTLVKGKNEIEVFSASADGSWESEPARIVLNYEKPLAKPTLHLVSVGISKYAEETMHLKFATADAAAMTKMFQSRGPALYGEGNVRVTQVTDSQSTKAGILAAITKVSKEASPQDTFVLFLAGHGTMVGQRYYFVPFEYQGKADRIEDDIRKQGLPGDELNDAIGTVPALKRVLIYDTCQSGGAVALTRTARSPFAFRGALERMSRATGSFIIAATAASSIAHEIDDLEHGVLSYTLLAGAGESVAGPLKNQRVGSDDKKTLDVREWFNYAQDKVPNITKLYLGQEQFVEANASGSNFPILPLNGQD